MPLIVGSMRHVSQGFDERARTTPNIEDSATVCDLRKSREEWREARAPTAHRAFVGEGI